MSSIINSKNGIHNKIVDFLVPHIRKWVADGKKIVIGIEGNSGSGKTTLSFALSKIFTDSCRLSTDLFISDDKGIIDKGLKSKKPLSFFLNNYYNYKRLKEDIQKFKKANKETILTFNLNNKIIKIDLNRRILFLDGVFLSNSKLASVIDKKFFLILQRREILLRRKERFKNRVGGKYDGRFAQKLDEAWEEYLEKNRPDEKSNLVLNIRILR